MPLDQSDKGRNLSFFNLVILINLQTRMARQQYSHHFPHHPQFVLKVDDAAVPEFELEFEFASWVPEKNT